MSLDYEKKKYIVLKEMVERYKEELLQDREHALNMPIETENGFNIERETIITDIDDKLNILKRHASSPYFAKLIFEDIDDKETFNGYIGRLSIGEINSPTDNKIVDWRAPIADLYYNGRLGNTKYSALGKEYNVDLKLKRQIDIKDGVVNSVYDFEDSISSDEFLKPYLTQSADNRLKNIVSTIQEEQNAIIRLPIFRNCIVQGVAGSGKTTVALHRLSYLMYNYKKAVRPEEFLIISPNDIFLSYISNILVDLDADKSNSFSFSNIINQILKTNYEILSKQAQFNKLNKLNISTKYLGFKNSLAFAEALEKFIKEYITRTCQIPLKYNGVVALEDIEVGKYFTYSPDTTLSNIIQFGSQKLALALQYTTALQDRISHNLDKENISLNKKFDIMKNIRSGNFGHIKKLIKSDFNPITLYTEFISNLHKYTEFEEMDILKKYTLANLKNKILAYDDLASIVYLAARLIDFPYFSKLKSIFIDEAQDISPLMFLALRKIFKSATFSIFGDIAQGIYSYQAINNWNEIQNIIGDCDLLYLKRSYRTSIEITEEANKTLTQLGFTPANNVVRNGEQVDYYNQNDCEFISKLISELKHKYTHTAIICKDDNDLLIAQNKLASLNLVILDENNLSYSNSATSLLTVQTAKGLEFDSVIIYDRNAYTDSANDLKLLYVAQTRALHKLITLKNNK